MKSEDLAKEDKNPQEQEYKSLWAILGPTLTYCLSSFYFGYSLVYFNTISYSTLERIYHLDIDRGIGEGTLSGCNSFGAIFGSMGQ